MSVGTISSHVTPIPRPTSAVVTRTDPSSPPGHGAEETSNGRFDLVSIAGESPPRSAPAAYGPTPSGLAQEVSSQSQAPSQGATLEQDSADKKGAGKETERASRELERRGRTADRREELSDEELAEVRQLEQRNAEVKKHEQAHVAAGGQYVRGGASFQYDVGADGKRYAVAGEVSIDISEASSPHATIDKARAVRRAALAPATPSAQDRSVAAQAMAMESSARAEIARENRQDEKQPDNAQADMASRERSPAFPPAARTQHEETAAAQVPNTNGTLLAQSLDDMGPVSVAASGASAGIASAGGTGADAAGRADYVAAGIIARSAAVAGAVKTYTQNGLHPKSFPSKNEDATRQSRDDHPGLSGTGSSQSRSPRVASTIHGKATLDLSL